MQLQLGRVEGTRVGRVEVVPSCGEVNRVTFLTHLHLSAETCVYTNTGIGSGPGDVMTTADSKTVADTRMHRHGSLLSILSLTAPATRALVAVFEGLDATWLSEEFWNIIILSQA